MGAPRCKDSENSEYCVITFENSRNTMFIALNHDALRYFIVDTEMHGERSPQ